MRFRVSPRRETPAIPLTEPSHGTQLINLAHFLVTIAA